MIPSRWMQLFTSQMLSTFYQQQKGHYRFRGSSKKGFQDTFGTYITIVGTQAAFNIIMRKMKTVIRSFKGIKGDYGKLRVIGRLEENFG